MWFEVSQYAALGVHTGNFWSPPLGYCVDVFQNLCQTAPWGMCYHRLEGWLHGYGPSWQGSLVYLQSALDQVPAQEIHSLEKGNLGLLWVSRAGKKYGRKSYPCHEYMFLLNSFAKVNYVAYSECVDLFVYIYFFDGHTGWMSHRDDRSLHGGCIVKKGMKYIAATRMMKTFLRQLN